MADPQRGEVWLVDLGYVAKVRPCLVISTPVQDQDRALVTLIAHTTSPRASRFEVEIKARFLRPGVFDAQNLITVPHAKLIRKLGTLVCWSARHSGESRNPELPHKEATLGTWFSALITE